jgi:tape measure domain-containing protein
MAGNEIANAYVALTVKAPGIKSDIALVLGSPDVDRSFSNAGSKFGSSLTKAIGGVAIAGVAAVGAVAAAGLGTALVKGFQRLDAIDVAGAKLRGLGNDAEAVDAIMENALNSVRGTAFGLGDASTVAAQIVAAGIAPGEQLEAVLKSVANSAAAAGTSLGDMGSIFAKVASTGKAQNDALQQVAERGIPIYQALATQLGVTTEEVFSMASAGKIGFAEFEQAATAAAGTVATEMGGTVQGSLSNLNASLGRIGAGLLGGVFDEIAPTFQSITAALGPLETVAGAVGQQIGSVLQPGFEALRGLTQGGFDFAQFAELLQYVSPLAVAFQALTPVLPVIGAMLGEIATTIGPVLVQVVQALLPILTGFIQIIAELAAALLPVILPLIQMLADLFAQVVEAVLPLLEPLFELIQAILPILIGLFQSLMPVIELIVGVISDILVPVIDTLVAVLTGLIDFLVGVFTGDWEKAWGGIVDVFTGIFEGVQSIGRAVINGLIDIINGFIAGLNGVGDLVSDITGGGVDFTIGSIPHLAEGGVVSKSRGGTLAVVGEGRYDEAVVPLSPDVLSQLGGAGDVNVYQTFENSGPDAAEVAGISVNGIADVVLRRSS